MIYNKTKQNKTKQNKTKQNKSKRNRKKKKQYRHNLWLKRYIVVTTFIWFLSYSSFLSSILSMFLSSFFASFLPFLIVPFTCLRLYSPGKVTDSASVPISQSPSVGLTSAQKGLRGTYICTWIFFSSKKIR